MGQTLSEPVVEKVSTETPIGNSRIQRENHHHHNFVVTLILFLAESPTDKIVIELRRW